MQVTAPPPPTFTSTAKGLVPASGGGTTTYLRADATFATVTASTNYGQIIAARMGALMN